MKKKIFNTLMALTMFAGTSSIALGSEFVGEMSQDCKDSPVICAISAPTYIPMMSLMIVTVGPVDLSMNTKANEAVAAAQEPAFLVSNNQIDATENPLFRNAVAELKKQNPQIQDVNDQEMATVILSIGEKLTSQ